MTLLTLNEQIVLWAGSQLSFACSKLPAETPEKDVKYKVNNKNRRTTSLHGYELSLGCRSLGMRNLKIFLFIYDSKKKKTENEPSVRCLFQIKTGHNFVVL